MASQFQVIIQLVLAVVLGGLIGLEREYKRKEAGLRTYALVCLGATLFTVVSFSGFEQFLWKQGVNFDPSRIAAQVVLGVGFIGAGLIVYRRFHVEGLTSAAGLWVTAAIGVAVGCSLYLAALLSALLAVVILWLARKFEEKFLNTKGIKNDPGF